MTDGARRARPVTIVVPAYNARETIGACLAACLAQDYSGAFSVTVVDDGSTDGTARVVEGFKVKSLRQDNRGPAAARNAGWRACDTPIVAFTDADCQPRRDWLTTLTRALEEPGVGAAGGTYDAAAGTGLLGRCVHEEIVLRHARLPRRVRYLGGFSLAVRRETLEKIGGFDESYPNASAEDNDFSYRLRKAGFELSFDPKARVAHRYRDGLGRYLAEQERHGYWRMKLYVDHPEMAGGDGYTYWKDGLEPILVTAAALSLICWRARWGRASLASLLTLDYLLQLGPAFAIAKARGDLTYLAFAPLGFLRGFARAAGAWRGVARFGFARRRGR